MGPGIGNAKYILVVKDDLSNYLWLVHTESPCAASCARTLAQWIRTFGAMTHWVSDQGSHFKKKFMHSLAEDYQISHRFTVTYSPWVNGTVESVMRKVQAN